LVYVPGWNELQVLAWLSHPSRLFRQIHMTEAFVESSQPFPKFIDVSRLYRHMLDNLLFQPSQITMIKETNKNLKLSGTTGGVCTQQIGEHSNETTTKVVGVQPEIETALLPSSGLPTLQDEIVLPIQADSGEPTWKQVRVEGELVTPCPLQKVQHLNEAETE